MSVEQQAGLQFVYMQAQQILNAADAARPFHPSSFASHIIFLKAANVQMMETLFLICLQASTVPEHRGST